MVASAIRVTRSAAVPSSVRVRYVLPQYAVDVGESMPLRTDLDAIVRVVGKTDIATSRLKTNWPLPCADAGPFTSAPIETFAQSVRSTAGLVKTSVSGGRHGRPRG